MCTFCGKNYNSRPRTKTVRIYGKKDNYLGQKEVHIDTNKKDVRQSLYIEYPDWDYFTGFEK